MPLNNNKDSFHTCSSGESGSTWGCHYQVMPKILYQHTNPIYEWKFMKNYGELEKVSSDEEGDSNDEVQICRWSLDTIVEER